MLFPCMDSSAYMQTYVLVLDAPIICFPFQFVKKKQKSASINWQKCSVQVLHRSVLYRAIGACWKIAFSSIAQCIRLSYTKPVRRKRAQCKSLWGNPLRESNKGIDRYRSSFSNALWRKEKRIGNCSVARECKALHQSKSRNETPQSAAPTAPLIGEPTLPPLLGEVPPQGAEGFFIFLRFHGRLNSYKD